MVSTAEAMELIRRGADEIMLERGVDPGSLKGQASKDQSQF